MKKSAILLVVGVGLAAATMSGPKKVRTDRLFHRMSGLIEERIKSRSKQQEMKTDLRRKLKQAQNDPLKVCKIETNMTAKINTTGEVMAEEVKEDPYEHCREPAFFEQTGLIPKLIAIGMALAGLIGIGINLRKGACEKRERKMIQRAAAKHISDGGHDLPTVRKNDLVARFQEPEEWKPEEKPKDWKTNGLTDGHELDFKSTALGANRHLPFDEVILILNESGEMMARMEKHSAFEHPLIRKISRVNVLVITYKDGSKYTLTNGRRLLDENGKQVLEENIPELLKQFVNPDGIAKLPSPEFAPGLGTNMHWEHEQILAEVKRYPGIVDIENIKDLGDLLQIPFTDERIFWLSTKDKKLYEANGGTQITEPDEVPPLLAQFIDPKHIVKEMPDVDHTLDATIPKLTRKDRVPMNELDE